MVVSDMIVNNLLVLFDGFGDLNQVLRRFSLQRESTLGKTYVRVFICNLTS